MKRVLAQKIRSLEGSYFPSPHVHSVTLSNRIYSNTLCFVSSYEDDSEEALRVFKVKKNYFVFINLTLKGGGVGEHSATPLQEKLLIEEAQTLSVYSPISFAYRRGSNNICKFTNIICGCFDTI